MWKKKDELVCWKKCEFDDLLVNFFSNLLKNDYKDSNTLWMKVTYNPIFMYYFFISWNELMNVKYLLRFYSWMSMKHYTTIDLGMHTI